MAADSGPSNRVIAELLCAAAEEGERTVQQRRALRRAGRAAFRWSVEARDLLARGQSLTELRAVGPWIARIIEPWILDPPVAPPAPPIRQSFLTRTEVDGILSRHAAAPRVRGDLQMHTFGSDGADSVADMATAALERGLEYIAITDHSKGLAIANGMNESQLAAQGREIDELNGRLAGQGFRILRAVEMNLSPAGAGDLESEFLQQLDLVLGAFHSRLRVTDDQTERYLAALENPHIHVLAHPRGRIFNFRLGLHADWERVFDRARARNRAVEIDAFPDRQDLDVELLKQARDAGALISIGSDSHSQSQLAFLDYGIAAAREVGIPAERILNCWNADTLRAWTADGTNSASPVVRKLPEWADVSARQRRAEPRHRGNFFTSILSTGTPYRWKRRALHFLRRPRGIGAGMQTAAAQIHAVHKTARRTRTPRRRRFMTSLLREDDVRSRARSAIRETNAAERVARALGWMSVGLGAAKLVSPRAVARAAGLDAGGSFAHGVAAPIVRALGARDLGTGLAIVSGARPRALWSRVAGDLFDLGWLAARSRRAPASSRVATAAVAVAGVATVGIICAQRLSAPRKPSYREESDGSVRFVHSIAINQPPDVCYRFWRRAENLPRVMPSLERVVPETDRRTRWIGKGGVEWTAEITEDSPPNLIAWRSTGGDLVADGSIRFVPAPNGRGTFVRSVYRYRPPVGTVGNWIARLVGRDPESEMRESLRRLKQILETGDVITVENQSRGPGRPTLVRAVSAA